MNEYPHTKIALNTAERKTFLGLVDVNNDLIINK